MSDISILIDAVDNASGVLNQIAGKTSALGTSASTATPQVGALGGQLGGLGKTLLGSLGPIAGFTSLTGAVLGFIKIGKAATAAAADAEMANVKLAQSLLSSGRGAEISAAEIDKFANSLMIAANIDDEKIKDAYAAIAGFQNLPTDKMDDIVKIAADMAAMFGGDLATNATMVAGVLETGLIPRTWRFDAALKEQIQSMIKAGETGGALTLVLDELNRKYGGQAAAQVDTYTGSVKGLGIAWGEFLEIQGKAITENVVVKETIDSLTSALQGVTTGQDAYNRAKKLGIKITMQDIEEYSKLHDIYDINIIRLRLVEEAELAAGKAAYYLSGGASEAAIAAAKMAAGFKATGGDVNDYTGQLKFLLTSSKSYGDYLTTLAGLEGEMIEARKKGGKSVEDLTAKIADLKAKNKDAMNSMVVDWAQAAAAVGGTSRDEMESVLGLAGALGEMSDEAITTALKMWDLQVSIEAIMKLPAEIRKHFIFDVSIFGLEAALVLTQIAGGYKGGDYTFFESNIGNPAAVTVPVAAPTGGSGNPYWIPDPGNPGHYKVNPLFKGASGGSFSGWAVVGDAPGRTTGYEELIYAPGGAKVYSNAQMRGKKSSDLPHFAGGSYSWDYSPGGRYYKGPSPLPTEDYSGAVYWPAPSGKVSPSGLPPFVGIEGGGGGATPSPTITPQSIGSIQQIVAQAAQQASQQAVSQAVSATSGAVQSVSVAAEQISQSGQETTIATRQGTQTGAQGDATIIARLDDIKTLLERSFASMPRQWAAAAARVIR